MVAAAEAEALAQRELLGVVSAEVLSERENDAERVVSAEELLDTVKEGLPEPVVQPLDEAELEADVEPETVGDTMLVPDKASALGVSLVEPEPEILPDTALVRVGEGLAEIDVVTSELAVPSIVTVGQPGKVQLDLALRVTEKGAEIDPEDVVVASAETERGALSVRVTEAEAVLQVEPEFIAELEAEAVELALVDRESEALLQPVSLGLVVPVADAEGLEEALALPVVVEEREAEGVAEAQGDAVLGADTEREAEGLPDGLKVRDSRMEKETLLVGEPVAVALPDAGNVKLAREVVESLGVTVTEPLTHALAAEESVGVADVVRLGEPDTQELPVRVLALEAEGEMRDVSVSVDEGVVVVLTQAVSVGVMDAVVDVVISIEKEAVGEVELEDEPDTDTTGLTVNVLDTGAEMEGVRPPVMVSV
jgi:hypothetical protein